MPTTGNSESADVTSDQESRSRLFRLIRKLSINEWLTLLVGVGTLLLSIGSLAVAYWTYRVSADSTDIKSAIGRLSDLATQTKRQADHSGSEIGILKSELKESTAQTQALADQAGATSKIASADNQAALAAVKSLGIQNSTFSESFRPKLDITGLQYEDFLETTSDIKLSIGLEMRNTGNVTASAIAWAARLRPYSDVGPYQRISCETTDRVIQRTSANPLMRFGATQPAANAPTMTFNLVEPIKPFQTPAIWGSSGKDYLAIMVVGCVSYTGRGSNIHHIRFAYAVGEARAGEWQYIDAVPQTIPKDRLRIGTMPAGISDD
jgi:hypothetical protein